ncbi:MAG: MBL fold metallo-hydrolase [Actinomycetota bacterium]
MSEATGSEHLTWSIGSVEVTRVEENLLALPTKVLVPDITLAQIEAKRPWVDPYFLEPNGDEPVLSLSIHSFVVRSADTVIVVDTCVGPDMDRGLPGDPAFLDRLDGAIDGGLPAVDVVICTHLHFDHVGWNAVAVDGSLVPAFPNARYLVSLAEMDELDLDDHMKVRDPSVQPLVDAGVLDIIEVPASGYRVTDEITLVPTPGHTLGHVSVLIRSTGPDGSATGLITGDAFHNPLQFAYPELAAWRFDTDADQSTATRRQLLDDYTDTGTLMLGTHFAPPTAGVLRRGESGVWFDDR